MYGNEEISKLKPEEILLYSRKSQSDDPSLTVEEVLAKHEEILNRWCMNNIGELIPEENRFREVVSGETIADRPEVQKVLKLLESPKYKALLIVEVQRLSRGDLEDAGRLIKLLRYTNTFVFTEHRNYDLRDEYDRDYFERELKRGNEFLEYQKKILNRGRLISVQQGNYIGSAPPYGFNIVWQVDGNKKYPVLEENKEEADVVRLMFDLYVNEDLGYIRIARKLDELGIKPPRCKFWSSAAIKDMLSNVHYIGKVKWNHRKTVTIVEDSNFVKSRPISKTGEYIICEGKHEGIISKELFDLAEAKRGRNHRAKPDTKIRNPFSSLVFCECGRAMIYRTYVNKGVVLGEPRMLCGNQSYCKNASCNFDEFTENIIDVLKQCIEDFEVKLKNNESNSAQLHSKIIAKLEKNLEELNKKEINLWEKYAEEEMPKHIFDTLNEKVLKEKEEVQQALCNAKKSMPEAIDYEEKILRFKDALDALNNPNVDATKKNKLLKACIERITYKRQRGECRKINSPMELDVQLRL